MHILDDAREHSKLAKIAKLDARLKDENNFIHMFVLHVTILFRL